MPFIFKEEGGLSMIRSDPGNWTGGKVGVGSLKGTNYGIAAHSHPNLDIKNLTQDGARVIYANEYWGPSGCALLPPGVDLSIFDPAVNGGVGRGKKFRDATASITDPQARIKKISASRSAWYKGLSTFKTFGKVWLGRTARCEAASLKLYLAAIGSSAVVITSVLQKEAKAAEVQVKKGQAGAVAAGGGAGGVAVSPAAEGGVSWGLVVVGVVICLVLLGIAIHFIRAKDERRKALSEAALEPLS